MAFKMKGFSAFTKEKNLPEEEASRKSAETEEQYQANWPEWPKDGSGLTWQQVMDGLNKDLSLAKSKNEKNRIAMIEKEITAHKKLKNNY